MEPRRKRHLVQTQTTYPEYNIVKAQGNHKLIFNSSYILSSRHNHSRIFQLMIIKRKNKRFPIPELHRGDQSQHHISPIKIQHIPYFKILKEKKKNLCGTTVKDTETHISVPLNLQTTRIHQNFTFVYQFFCLSQRRSTKIQDLYPKKKKKRRKENSIFTTKASRKFEFGDVRETNHEMKPGQLQKC